MTTSPLRKYITSQSSKPYKKYKNKLRLSKTLFSFTGLYCLPDVYVKASSHLLSEISVVISNLQ